MKTQGCLLYPEPGYVKTEEIAERKGVIFLHSRVCVSVCVCVCLCVSESENEKKWVCLPAWEAHGGKVRARRGEGEPGLQFADLSWLHFPVQTVDIPRTCGRGRRAPRPYLRGTVPLEVNKRESIQATEAGGRGGWGWSLQPSQRSQTDNFHLKFGEITRGYRLQAFPDLFNTSDFSHRHQKRGGKNWSLVVSVCLDGCENTSAPPRVKHQICKYNPADRPLPGLIGAEPWFPQGANHFTSSGGNRHVGGTWRGRGWKSHRESRQEKKCLRGVTQ